MYFITISTHRRVALFGQVENKEMRLNRFGEIVLEEWLKTAKVRPNVALDAFVIMPNHIHGVLFIMEQVEDRRRATGTVARYRRAPAATAD